MCVSHGFNKPCDLSILIQSVRLSSVPSPLGWLAWGVLRCYHCIKVISHIFPWHQHFFWGKKTSWYSSTNKSNWCYFAQGSNKSFLPTFFWWRQFWYLVNVCRTSHFIWNYSLSFQVIVSSYIPCCNLIFSCYHHGVWSLCFKTNCWHSSRLPLS